MATRIGLEVKNGQLNLAPGDKADVSIVITNSSEIVDAFDISVVGIDERWYTLSTQEARLFPRQVAPVTLSIHPPTAGMSTLAGYHAFTIMVVSRDNPTEIATEQGMITIASSGGLALALGPKRIAGRRGVYGAVVTNHSNAPRQFVLTATDPDEALNYSIGTPQERLSLDGEGTSAGSPRLPGTAYGVEGPPIETPPYGNTLIQGQRRLEHEMELAPGASVTVPLMVKPLDRVWFGREQAFPFQVGIHPPGVEWEATEAQVAQAQLAYPPIFGFLAGLPLGLRRLLSVAIPLLILGLLLFLLLRPQDGPVSNNSVSQTQTAQALVLSQTQTAVMQSANGNQAAANATMTALALSAGATGQTQTAQAQLTVSAQQTAAADAILFASGAVNIQSFFLNVGKDLSDGTRTESVIDYDVVGARDVNVVGLARPQTLTGLDNASMIDYTLVATGTNGELVTSTLGLLVFMPPTINRFDAEPNAVTAGGSTNLTWTIKGARDVTIDDIPVTSNPDGTGAITLTPTGTRRFIMCARNDAGMNCKALLITVLAPGQPTPTRAQPTPTDTPIRIPVVTNTPTITPVPVIPATPCVEDYIVEREESATPIPTGTLVPGSQCADCTVNVALPFTFALYNRLFDAVNIGANGTLSFATVSSPPTNTFFDNDTLNYSILPHWDNLTTAGTGRGIFTRTDGDAPDRIFTIGFRARYASDSTVVDFDVRLFENAPDQRIEVIYGTVAQRGRSASVGVQRDTEQRRTPYEFNEDGTLLPGYKVIFRMPCGAGITCATGAKIYLDPEAVLPNEVLVESGSVIIWINTEREPVAVEGGPAPGTTGEPFQSGNIPAAGRFERVFTTPGSYEFRSNSGPNINGRIRVVESCNPLPTATAAPRRTSTSVTLTATGTAVITLTATLQPTTTPTSRIVLTSTATATPPIPTGTATATSGIPTAPPPGFCPQIQTFTGSIDDKDPTQTGRIANNGSPSTCGVPSGCGVADSSPRNFDSYTFTNTSGNLQCVTVSLNAPNCDGRAAVMSVAYVGSFNPGSICQNYIASSGPVSTSSSYSVHVPNNTTIVIVVNVVEAGGSCGRYTVQVGMCNDRTPTLPPPPPPTNTFTAVPTSTRTFTPTSTLTRTSTRTSTPTFTPTSTPTFTPTITPTSTPTSTPTITPTATCIPANNYSYEIGTATYISATTQVLNGCNDDCVVPVTIPFPVRVYDQLFTSAQVGDNGTLTFSGPNPNPPTATCLPAANFAYTLFPLWRPMMMNVFGDGIYTSVQGTAPNRVFIIEWRASNRVCGIACFDFPFNFEVLLYETPPRSAQIDVVYGIVSGGGSDSTVGIQRDPGTVTQVACPVSNITPNTRISFFIPPCVVTTTPTATFPLPTSTATTTVTATPTLCPLTIYTFSNPITNTLVPAINRVPGSNCSNCNVPITSFPFPVRLYNQSFTQALASSNGYLQFVGAQTTADNTCLPAAAFQHTVFPFWHDLTTDAGADGIFTSTLGIAPNRTYVIEWRAFALPAEGPVQFQVRFTENQSDFQFVYGDMNAEASSTIGVQESPGNASQYACDDEGVIIDNRRIDVRIGCISGTPTSTSTMTPTITATPTPPGVCNQYVATVSSTSFTPGGTLVLGGCNDCSTAVPLQFPVEFYGQMYSSVMVSDNGTLQFTGNNTSGANTCLPASGFTNTIFAFWDDLNITSSGRGVFLRNGQGVIEIIWNALDGTGAITSFEVAFIFNSPGSIYLLYDQVPAGGSRATIGIQRDPTCFEQFSCNTSVITAGMLITYGPPSGGTPTPPTPTFTSTPFGTPTNTPTITPTFNPQCPPNGYCITTDVNGGPSAPNPARTLFDEGTVTLTAPFPIRLYNTSTTTLTAGDNGTMQLGTTNPNTQANTCTPNAVFNNALFPYWDSITMLSAGQGIYTSTAGIIPNRVYRVVWTGTLVSTGLPVTFAINFFENTAGNIHFEFQYGPGANGNTATIGVQEASGTRFSQWACNGVSNTCSGCYLVFTYQGLPDEPARGQPPTAIPVSTQLPPTTSTASPATATLTTSAPATASPPGPTATSGPRFGAASNCQTWASHDVDKAFEVSGILESSLTVPRDGIISSISLVGLDLSKPGGRTLNASLFAPDGTRAELFKWGCEGKRVGQFHWLDMSLRTSSRSSISNLYCSEGLSGGEHEPGGKLDLLDGTRARGEWTLQLQTTSPRNAAFSELNSWGLEVCYARDPASRTMIAGVTTTGNSGLDLVIAVIFAAIITVGMPVAWAKRTLSISGN